MKVDVRMRRGREINEGIVLVLELLELDRCGSDATVRRSTTSLQHDCVLAAGRVTWPFCRRRLGIGGLRLISGGGCFPRNLGPLQVTARKVLKCHWRRMGSLATVRRTLGVWPPSCARATRRRFVFVLNAAAAVENPPSPFDLV